MLSIGVAESFSNHIFDLVVEAVDVSSELVEALDRAPEGKHRAGNHI